MESYLVGYTVLGIIVLFIIFSVLVKKRVLFGYTPAVQKIFAHPLLHYSIRRIISALISVVLAILVTFFLVRLAQPADQTCITKFSGPHVTPELFELQCNAWKKDMGFSGSILEQLWNFFYSILPIPKTLCRVSLDSMSLTYTVSDCRNFIIDLGKISDLPGVEDGIYVIDYMLPRMATSFKIGIVAVIVELGLGYPIGVLMAKYKDGIFDKIGLGYIISIDAIPGVAYYYIWMAILCGLIGLPRAYSSDNFLSWLPAILTMGFTGMAGISMWVRRFMVDEFTSDYVKFARAKGLSENRIMFTHVLRNAIVPLVRSIPAAIIGALMGTYFLENIYSINGIGAALLVANNTKNALLLQAIIIISALLSIFSYLLGDIVTAMVDPRVSFSNGD
ncbi:MAG: ABC transporter permease [Erysipelotrichaceae bacterium]|jgi:oligopeptide transport system permease protein|nr:ABC transporter permease [Erysipelotrichaceae bacterium]